jgi:hypothetical protein
MSSALPLEAATAASEPRRSMRRSGRIEPGLRCGESTDPRWHHIVATERIAEARGSTDVCVRRAERDHGREHSCRFRCPGPSNGVSSEVTATRFADHSRRHQWRQPRSRRRRRGRQRCRPSAGCRDEIAVRIAKLGR